MNRAGRIVLLALLVALAASRAPAQLLFSDNFTSGASASWGNEVGSWAAAGGVYNAGSPNNLPATYSSLPYALTDFSVTFTVNALQDGGVWLRSSSNTSGVLLVTGGHGGSGTGLYWHEITPANSSAPTTFNEVAGLFTPGVSNAVITVTVVGNTYSAFVNGSSTAATTFSSSMFASGQVALYDFSGQTFDNVSLTAIPEPADFAALAAGFAAMGGWWARRNRRVAAERG